MAILGWLCAVCKLCNPFLSEIFDVHGKGFHCWLYVCRICFWAVFLPFCLSQLAFQRWWLCCSWFHKSCGYLVATGMNLGFLFLMMPEQRKCINKTRSIHGSPGILLFRLCTQQWYVVLWDLILREWWGWICCDLSSFWPFWAINFKTSAVIQSLKRSSKLTDVISKWSSSDQNGSNCFPFCQSVNPQDCLHVLFIDVIPFFWYTKYYRFNNAFYHCTKSYL